MTDLTRRALLTSGAAAVLGATTSLALPALAKPVQTDLMVWGSKILSTEEHLRRLRRKIYLNSQYGGYNFKGYDINTHSTIYYHGTYGKFGQGYI